MPQRMNEIDDAVLSVLWRVVCLKREVEAWRSHQRAGGASTGARCAHGSARLWIYQPSSFVSYGFCGRLSGSRSSTGGMLRVTRQFGALALAAGVDARVRWLPSGRNQADEPSRPGSRARGADEKAVASPGSGSVSIGAVGCLVVRQPSSNQMILEPLDDRELILPTVPPQDTDKRAQSLQKDPRHCPSTEIISDSSAGQKHDSA